MLAALKQNINFLTWIIKNDDLSKDLDIALVLRSHKALYSSGLIDNDLKKKLFDTILNLKSEHEQTNNLDLAQKVCYLNPELLKYASVERRFQSK